MNRLPADRRRGQAFIGRVAGRRVAAFAVAPPLEVYNKPSLGVALHLEPCLSAASTRSLEQTIIRKARQIAEGLDQRNLVAWPPPEQNSPTALRYTRLGFTEFNRLTIYHVDREALRRVIARPLSHRAATPTLFETRPLHAVDPHSVLDVWEQHLQHRGGLRVSDLNRLRGEHTQPFDPQLSKVMVKASRVVGICLVSTHRVQKYAADTRCPGPGCSRIEADVEVLAVAPEASWQTLRLIGDGVQAAAERQIEQLRFFANSTGTFTHRLAGRCNATVASCKLQMYRSVHQATADAPRS